MARKHSRRRMRGGAFSDWVPSFLKPATAAVSDSVTNVTSAVKESLPAPLTTSQPVPGLTPESAPSSAPSGPALGGRRKKTHRRKSRRGTRRR